MKNYIKLIVFVFLSFIVFALVMIPDAAATGSYSGTVTADSLNVRSKPTASSTVVGWLPKGSIINIHSTQQGWGETYYKNKKAYVSLKYIKLSSMISFKKDKTKTYLYNTYGDKNIYKFVSSSNFGTPYRWEKWTSQMGEIETFYERESKGELLTTSNLKDHTVHLKYPLFVGQSWKPNPKNETFKITSLNKTIITPAGKFTKVIEVKQGSTATYYFAKNIGLIKKVENGKTVDELQKITKN